MKILFLTEQFPYPLHDGGNLRTFHLLRGLSQGNAVTLVSHSPEQGRQNGVRELESFCRVKTVDKPPLPQRLMGSLPRYGVRIRSLFALKNWSQPLLQKASQQLEIDSFDVLHLNHLDTACLSLARKWNLPKVFDTHNCLSAMARQVSRDDRRWLNRRIYTYESHQLRRLERLVTERMDMNLVCSENDAETFRELSPRARFVVAPNGVDVDEFQMPDESDEEPMSVLFTGAMNYYPNEQAAIYFCSRILPLLDDLKLRVYFVGRDPTPRVQALQDGETVVVTGRVPDIRPFMSKSQVFVVPLHHGSGTRLKILEAFAMRKAVVSTPLGAEGIPARDGEEIILAEDAEKFATAVRQLLLDASRRKRLGDAARKLVCERFDWKMVNRRVDEAYATLGNEKHAVAH